MTILFWCFSTYTVFSVDDVDHAVCLALRTAHASCLPGYVVRWCFSTRTFIRWHLIIRYVKSFLLNYWCVDMSMHVCDYNFYIMKKILAIVAKNIVMLDVLIDALLAGGGEGLGLGEGTGEGLGGPQSSRSLMPSLIV